MFDLTADVPLHNLQGQVVGPKGLRTRLRLIETLESLVQSCPLRELRVMDICREARTAPGTFYLYFKDVQDLALEAIRIYQKLPPELDELLNQEWPRSEALALSRRFVNDYACYWDAHFHLLQVRNLTADEGDARMIELRYACLVPVLERLADKIAPGQRAAMPHPMAAATVVMASLERMASVLRLIPAQREDITRHQVIEAQAWVLANLMGYSQE
ncbi:TetR/AcrR family transcriptional regulator [Pseudomonas silvicola]|nr:TetR/AcrR family transcriptional regulator [Pseudomonas silvicola]